MSGKLKEVRDRMKSVRSTQQITSAMKMVSAAKLRRAQDAITHLRPYSDKLYKIMDDILHSIDLSVVSSYIQEREVNNVLMVVVTSNRGLCGAFNTNIIKEAVKRIDKKYPDVRSNGGITFLCIGKRGQEYFMKRYPGSNFINDYVDQFSDLSYKGVSKVADFIIEGYIAGEWDAVDITYGEFKNPATQYPKMIRFLPVPILPRKPKSKRRDDYIYEPSRAPLMDALFPTVLRNYFFKFLLDTHASEHGARMTAMDKATENAEELLKDLRINYNKARQEAITKELSEIVGGAAALEGA